MSMRTDKVVDGLLKAQKEIADYPELENLLAFLGRTIQEIPGVKDVAACTKNSVAESSPQIQKVCKECHRNGLHKDLKCAFLGTKGAQAYPMEAGKGFLGNITVLSSGGARYETIEPHIKDLISTGLQVYADHEKNNSSLPPMVLNQQGDPLSEQGFQQKSLLVPLGNQVSRGQEEKLFSLSPDMICVIDQDGSFLRLNPAWKKNLGLPEVQMLANPFTRFVHPNDIEKTNKDFFNCLETDGSVNGFISRFRCMGGSYKWLEWNAVRDGNLIYAFARDVTLSKKDRDHNAMTAAIFDTTVEAIMVSDPYSRVLRVNPAFTKITGYSEEDILGKPPSTINSDRYDREFFRGVFNDIGETGQWQSEIVGRRKNGEEFPKWISCSVIRDDNGHIREYITVFSDMTKFRDTEAKLHKQTHFDPLTNLPNRTLFLEQISAALSWSDNQKQLLGVFLVDIDRFKGINDSLGHKTGDKILFETSKRLTACLGKASTISRLSSDEFAIIIPDIKSEDDLVPQARKILEIMSKPIYAHGHEIFISVSIGITLYPSDGDANNLLKNADAALLCAKEEGRNTYRFFTPELNQRAIERLSVESQMRRALAEDNLTLHYQPQICLASGNVVGFEALLRCKQSDGSQTLPPNVIPIAEETGLIIPIGKFIIQSVCRQIRQWQDAGTTNARVGLNVSPRQFLDRELIDTLQSCLDETAINPDSLELEITESLLMQNLEGAGGILGDIHAMGIRLSIDDFGTGYSSLSYLKQMPIHSLKIDRSFVTNLPSDKDDAAIVTAIISMGQSLGLEIVAEGVENREQLAFLKKYNCELGQGYLFGRPENPEKMKKHVQKVHSL